MVMSVERWRGRMRTMGAWMTSMMVTVLSFVGSRVWRQTCVMIAGVRGTKKQERYNIEEA
jgi:hypothetical protein